jgi:3-oxoacyl-[acyl-carrier protein] reductase
MDLQLQGKVALVTAASRGIGRAVGHQLATEGATTVLSSRDKDALSSAVEAVGPVAGRLAAAPCDLADSEATGRLIPEVVDQYGPLDALVINTPAPPIKPFLQTSLDDWATAYDALVRPALQLAGAGAELMAERGGGSIVFLTSTWVTQPTWGGGLSAGPRSLLSGLAKQMALELAPSGVRVNQLMPGATGTDRMRTIVTTKAAANNTSVEQEIAAIAADIPLGRWAEADEIARSVAFLISPASSFTTGSATAVDGGAVRSTL